jgi:hypothetical protein
VGDGADRVSFGVVGDESHMDLGERAKSLWRGGGHVGSSPSS